MVAAARGAGKLPWMRPLTLAVLVFLLAAAAAAQPPAPAPSPAPEPWIPGPAHLLLKLQDPDPAIRARNVGYALRVSTHDFRVVELLSRLMDDASNEPTVRLEAACLVATQDTAFAKSGALRVLELIDETGYPQDRLGMALNAVARQGDEILDELENLASRGDLSDRFYRLVLGRINTPNAKVALDRTTFGQTGAERHRVHR